MSINLYTRSQRREAAKYLKKMGIEVSGPQDPKVFQLLVKAKARPQVHMAPGQVVPLNDQQYEVRPDGWRKLHQ